MKIARFVVAKELETTEDFLKAFPADVGIIDIKYGEQETEYTVTHPELNDVILAEGCEYPLLTPTITSQEDGTLVWDWNQNATSKQYDVCTECDVKHYTNCRTCFGFGVSRNTNTPISAGLANHMLAEDWIPCPECGSTVTGMPNP